MDVLEKGEQAEVEVEPDVLRDVDVLERDDALELVLLAPRCQRHQRHRALPEAPPRLNFRGVFFTLNFRGGAKIKKGLGSFVSHGFSAVIARSVRMQVSGGPYMG